MCFVPFFFSVPSLLLHSSSRGFVWLPALERRVARAPAFRRAGFLDGSMAPGRGALRGGAGGPGARAPGPGSAGGRPGLSGGLGWGGVLVGWF